MANELGRFQPHAFLLLPISFNVAAMASPLMAGQLADLAGKYPDRFGNNAFLIAWPYAPPAILSGCIMLLAFFAVFLFLEEVSPYYSTCNCSPKLTTSVSPDS